MSTPFVHFVASIELSLKSSLKSVEDVGVGVGVGVAVGVGVGVGVTISASSARLSKIAVPGALTEAIVPPFNSTRNAVIEICAVTVRCVVHVVASALVSKRMLPLAASCRMRQ